MNSHPSTRRPGLFGRPILTVTIVLAAVAAVSVGSVAFASRNTSNRTVWHAAPEVRSPAPVEATATPSDGATPSGDAAGGSVTLSATGDIMMSNAPQGMPPADGAGFFDDVRDALRSDLVMGNLEQPLTDDTGTSKCGSPPRTDCFAFRSPPSYARHLDKAGFQLVNLANNHTRDFGPAGARNTRKALDGAGIAYTGNAGEITIVEIKGRKVAVVGFSTYAGANNLNDLDASRAVVRRAKERADLVVVQAHMGGEGTDRQHVKPGTETFSGENRGDPVRFSHAVVDAGADLVIGHGPHVLRGIQFYRGKLIAYSLGNFAGGGHALKNVGALRYGGVLRVTLTAGGKFAGGEFRSTMMNAAGLPVRDRTGDRGRKMVAELSADDFGASAATITDDGVITPPA
jgi:poly-gamma-glutamate capsule biosynthesis protein CapA/YwtB (metallophosphatase superfamily)